MRSLTSRFVVTAFCVAVLAACAPPDGASSELAAAFPLEIDQITGRGVTIALDDSGGVRIASALLGEDSRTGFVLDDDIAVIELGLEAPLEVSAGDGYVAYSRGGRERSIFTATNTDGALEEWLVLQPHEDGVTASWRTSRGHFAMAGDDAVLIGGDGRVRFAISAPFARGASGRRYQPTLHAEGDLLTVQVDGVGQESLVLVDPIWRQAPGSTTSHRYNAGLLPLPNGKLMAIGGNKHADTGTEIYDPATGSWTAGPSLALERVAPYVVVLRTGKVLVCGSSGTDFVMTATCELYDPVANTFSAAASMLAPSAEGAATLLQDGRVLVTGGVINVWDPVNEVMVLTWIDDVQLYDPPSNTWTAGPPLPQPLSYQAAARLLDGRVLVVGGKTSNSVPTSLAQMYDPASNSWVPAQTVPNTAPGARLTPQPSGGAVLLVGGGGGTPQTRAYLFDAASLTWTAINTPAPTARVYFSTAQQANGRIALIGGLLSGGLSTTVVEEFNPANNTWATLPGVPGQAVYGAAVVVEPSARIAHVGGIQQDNIYIGTTRVLDLNVPTATNLNNAPHAHSNHTATLLTPSGLILVVGGTAAGIATTAVDYLNPTTGTWAVAPSLGQARFDHTATLTPGNKVVVIGGRVGSNPVAATEIFSGSFWSAGAPLAVARWSHTATLLDDGRILVAGGCVASGASLVKTSRVSIYNPVVNTWSNAASLRTERCGHTATLLPSKKILFAGGDGAATTTAEVYDVVANSSAYTNPLSSNHDTGATATLLPRGKVLVGFGRTGGVTSSRVDVYDPTTNSWIFSSTSVPRSGHTATLLPSGRVLFDGGTTSANGAAEEYDPETSTTTLLAVTTKKRSSLTATVAKDGRVALVGGVDGAELVSAERYDEGRAQSSALVPTLASPGSITAGTTVTITGTTFMGKGGVGIGGHTISVEASFPILQLMRIDDGQTTFATTTGFSTTTAQVLLPANLARGPTVIRVLVNGVLSDGVTTLVQ